VLQRIEGIFEIIIINLMPCGTVRSDIRDPIGERRQVSAVERMGSIDSAEQGSYFVSPHDAPRFLPVPNPRLHDPSVCVTL